MSTGVDRPRSPTVWLLAGAVLCTSGAGARLLGGDDPVAGHQLLRVVAAGLAGIVLMLRGVRIGNLWLRERMALVLLLWGYLTMFWSGNLADSLRTTGGYVSVMIVAAALAIELGARGATKLMALVLSGCSALSLALIYGLPEVGTIVVRHPVAGLTQQPIGVFAWNSDLAFGAAVAALLLAGLWVLERRKHQVVLIGLNLLVVAIAGSVTSAFAVLAGLTALALFLGPLARGVVLSAAVVLLLSVLTFGVEFIAGPVLDAFRRSADMTGRTQIWEATRAFIDERPLLGHGIGTDPPFYQYLGYETNHAHNGYLQMAFDRGFIGVALVIGLVVTALVRIRRGSWELAVLTVPVLCATLTANFANDYLTAAGLGVLALVWVSMSAAFEAEPRTGRQIARTRRTPTRPMSVA